MYLEKDLFCSEYNFGPNFDSNKSVKYLVQQISKHWEYPLTINELSSDYKESKLLHLQLIKLTMNWVGNQYGV